MAIRAYVKSAATQLRQAAQQVQNDIYNLNAELNQQERDKDGEVMRLRQTRRDTETEINRAQEEAQKREMLRVVADNKQQEIQVARQKDRTRQEIQDAIRGMEDQVRDLNQKAGDLESMAMQVD